MLGRVRLDHVDGFDLRGTGCKVIQNWEGCIVLLQYYRELYVVRCLPQLFALGIVKRESK